MSDIVLVALIAAVPGTIGAVTGLRNSRKITDVHKGMNSRFDEALAEARRAAEALGYKLGVEDERDRQAMRGVEP